MTFHVNSTRVFGKTGEIIPIALNFSYVIARRQGIVNSISKKDSDPVLIKKRSAMHTFVRFHLNLMWFE